jgi:hypothetical protein
MRRTAVIGATALATLILAAPVAANETVRWTDSHDITNTFSCDVIEETTATIEGTAFFDASGNWLKDVLRFSFDASFTDPATGKTITFTTRQVVLSDPGSRSFIGQGVFVRVPGLGAVLLDVGKLTIDPSDGSTIFRSAKSLAFDDPTVFDRYDAAICSLF